MVSIKRLIRHYVRYLKIILSFVCVIYLIVNGFTQQLVNNKTDICFASLHQIRQNYAVLIKRLFGLQNNSIQNEKLSLEYEKSIQKMSQNLDDLWLFLKQSLNSSQLKYFNEFRYNMLTDLQIIGQKDYDLRKQRLKSLNEFMSEKISKLQNPIDCKTARKLICNPEKYCGFGCRFHHWVHCLIGGMALNRTMIFEPNNPLDKLLLPLSNTCLESSGYNRTFWTGNISVNMKSYQVLEYPYHEDLNPFPKYYPLVIPQQISTELQMLSTEPFILFIGFVVKYLLRTNQYMDKYLMDFKNKIQFNHPIVGIHVRRTDKLEDEAKFHSLDEYMTFAEDFYNKMDLMNERNLKKTKVKRLIYLATDEKNVWNNETIKYSQNGYNFIGDVKHSETAIPQNRDSDQSILDLIIDILMLSECNLIICTFSSNVCRIAVELQQTRDPIAQYYSIDSNYYFAGQKFHRMKAILGNLAQFDKELNFTSGDLLGINDDLHTGYNLGDLNSDNKLGVYPRFKVEEFIQTYPFLAFE